VDLMLGARLAGEVKSDLQQKTVSHILDLEVPQLLKFQLLGATHSSVAVPRLIDVFQTEDNIYRLMDAAFALRSLGSKAAVPALLCALAHKNEMTIAIAAFALGALDDHSAIPALLNLLSHPHRTVGEYVVSSLGELRAKDAVPKLIEKLNDENDLHVRKEAIGALGEIGDEDAIPGLIKIVLHSNYLSLNAPDALKKINSEKASEELIKVLEDEDYKVRGKSIEALGEIGSDSAVEALLKALLEDSYVGWKAVEALKEIGSLQHF